MCPYTNDEIVHHTTCRSDKIYSNRILTGQNSKIADAQLP